MSVEAPVLESPASPAVVTEPAAPAPASGGSATPANTLPTRDELRAQRHKDVKAQLAALRESPTGTQAADAKAPEPKVTPTAAAEPPHVPTPKEPPSTPKDKAKAEPTSVKVSHKDKDGNPAEVEISLDQARRAILRDGYSVEGMTPQKILDTGARRHLAQSDNDRSWNDARLEKQRLAEENARLKGAPISPAIAAKVEAAAPAAAPSPPAQPSQPPAAGHAPDPALQADLAALQEQLGPDASAIVARMLTRLQPPTPADAAELAGLKTQLQQQQDYNANMLHLLVQNQFARGFEDFATDFPQLEGDGSDAIRADIQADWNALAQSGRWKNPLDPAAFKSVLREAVHARLGDQLQETHARQLQQQQKREKSGQIPSTDSRNAAPAAALSDRERRRAVALELIRTGSVDAASRKNNELQRPSG